MNLKTKTLFLFPILFFTTVVGNFPELFGLQQLRPVVEAEESVEVAGPQPILTWSVVPDAVYYEIEFLSRPPES